MLWFMFDKGTYSLYQDLQYWLVAAISDWDGEQTKPDKKKTILYFLSWQVCFLLWLMSDNAYTETNWK